MDFLKKLFSWLGGEIKQVVQIVKDNLFLVVGVGLFVGGLFDFGSGRYCETKGILPSLSRNECINPMTYYYYSEETIALLVVGAIFIIIGILRLRRK